MRGCLGMGKGSFGKAVRGFMETRHDRPRREKIVVSGTDGSVRRQKVMNQARRRSGGPFILPRVRSFSFCSFPGSLAPEITTRTVLHGPPRRGPFLIPWQIQKRFPDGPGSLRGEPGQSRRRLRFPVARLPGHGQGIFWKSRSRIEGKRGMIAPEGRRS